MSRSSAFIPVLVLGLASAALAGCPEEKKPDTSTSASTAPATSSAAPTDTPAPPSSGSGW